jgi:hypothetical protein
MRMNDDNIAQERKSEPLYRDVSSSGQSNFVRAKYAGLDVVDSRTVAMSILRVAIINHLNSCLNSISVNLLLEEEASIVPYVGMEETGIGSFRQPTSTGRFPSNSIASVCSLFFHDVTLYCLDVYLSFAVYFLFGGLHRPPTMPGARWPYVFPSLHNIQKESMAE